MKPVEHYWANVNPLSLLLLPLSLLFCSIAGLRRLLYKRGLKASIRVPAPVIVVGNISVGGTGKTPLVIRICHLLQTWGLKPGIVSRGYGGETTDWPYAVLPNSDPHLVGDEPLLLAQRTGCPVFISPKRPEAAQALLQQTECNVIVSDDGLQHYALKRDVEIAVVDGKRLFGNGFCLPSGPLRERLKRLEEVDFVISNGPSSLDSVQMDLQSTSVVNLSDPSIRCSPDDFIGQKVNAMAGIGNPQRFFDTLLALGLDINPHSFKDHQRYQPGDLPSSIKTPLIMTEKDAVKCRSFAEPGYWYLEVEAKLEEGFSKKLEHLIRDLNNG